jgi:hypothetical protein
MKNVISLAVISVTIIVTLSALFTSCSMFQSRRSRLMSDCQKECYYKDPETKRYTPSITWSRGCRCLLD